jgi:phage gpG-like protein
MPGMIFEMTGSSDAYKVAGLLHGGALAAQHTRPVMERIVVDMMRVEKRVFSGQGRRGGGSWPELAPDTVRKKGVGYQNILRTSNANPNYSKIGGAQSIDTLYRSLTQPGAPYQVLGIRNNIIRFGTSRPYAGAHQRGSWLRSIPARPFLTFLEADYVRWTRMIAEHLMEPFIRGSKK